MFSGSPPPPPHLRGFVPWYWLMILNHSYQLWRKDVLLEVAIMSFKNFLKPWIDRSFSCFRNFDFPSGGWVSTTQLKNMRKSKWVQLPQIGMKIPKIFELPPPRFSGCWGLQDACSDLDGRHFDVLQGLLGPKKVSMKLIGKSAGTHLETCRMAQPSATPRFSLPCVKKNTKRSC